MPATIPHALIIKFPGTNCDAETALALEAAGFTAEVLPVALLLGLGQGRSLGNAAAELDCWSAAGRSRTTDTQTRGRRSNGEEWA